MGGKILSVLRQCEIDKRKAQEKMDMASNSESLEYWRTFFGSATDDIFQVIENSIHIASQDHPAEFSGRCEQLIKSFTDSPQRKNEEEVMRVKDLLANWQQQVILAWSLIVSYNAACVWFINSKGHCFREYKFKRSENLIFESLRKLQSMELSVGVLKATKIERLIKHLRKHPIKRIKHLAKLLINCWKLLKDEQMNAAKRSETYDSQSVNLFPAKKGGCVSFLLALPVPDQKARLQATRTECFNRTATTIHSQTEHIDKEEDVVRHVLCSPVKPHTSYKRATNPQDVPSNAVTMTPLTQGFEQNKKCNDQLFQARLDTTKRKHRDTYLKEKLAKKQRCIKVIEFKDLPKKNYRHKMNDRCCPKKWTNCQAKYTPLPIS